jgi:murein DD-endopeptidase MepM/ murein hydrolase activator NlpD
MSDRVAWIRGRALPRLALAGLGLALLSGCSSDVTRFSATPSPFTGNPFSNPFASKTADATPTPAVTSAPLAQAAPAAAAAVTQTASARPQAVRGSAVGWTAAGGSPVVVAEGETLDTLSGRYGVPAAALLAANGLSSGSQVKSGMHIVVPVYHADGHGVASGESEKAKKRAGDVADAEAAKAAKAKKRAGDVADAEAAKAAKAKEKDLAKAEKPAGDAAKSASKDDAGGAVAYAEPGKPAQAKDAMIDKAPTGNLEAGAEAAKAPLTGAKADVAGVEPEFRWPARGRIIQGFKAGGNDGINISVPAGTSVRAAEAGVVVYSGDGLKGYGNLVLVKHPNGFVTAYGNNSELDVKRGEQVKRGQVIAKSGDTGNVNAPQLHVELRKGSTPVDPTNYLAGL